MVNYQCERCGYQTNDKNRYDKHINRKFQCKVVTLKSSGEAPAAKSPPENRQKPLKPARKPPKTANENLGESKNIDYYDVVVGMYHDQVLTPLKTLYNFNAINITIGLPFIRVSPDHGPNLSMYGKNKSDPSSIFCAMDFFNKI